MRYNLALKKSSICLVPLTNFFSGTERIVSDIGVALYKNQVDFSLVSPKIHVLDPLVHVLQDKAKSINYINSVVGRQTVGKNLQISYKIFKKVNPTVAHFHCPNYRWGLDVLLAAYLANVPIIRTEHNPLMAPPSPIIGLILKMLDRKTSKYIYVSNGNKQRFEHYLPYRSGKGVVVPNGVDPDLFGIQANAASRVRLRKAFGFPETSSIAVFVGAYGGRRPLKPIFEAFKQLITAEATGTEAQKWRLLIVGSGDEKEAKFVGELGIAPYVHFAGRRADIYDILPNCDLFVTASEYEGMSVAILEAWAAGLPLLATKVDGISDVVGLDKDKTLSVPVGDIKGYAATWYRIMTHATEIVEINKRASERVRQEFTIQNMVDKYLDLYEGCA